MAIFFDVGANDGSSMFHHAQDPNNTVYAFEPSPRMIEILKGLGKVKPNYKVI